MNLTVEILERSTADISRSGEHRSEMFSGVLNIYAQS